MTSVLGLKVAGHDTGAALVTDQGVVAIAEERLSRVKHSFNAFPSMAIEYCMKFAGIDADQIALVVIDRVGLANARQMPLDFATSTHHAFARAAVTTANHHDAHAASAFFASPFDEAAVLVYDGAGERTRSEQGVFVTETESLYHGAGRQLQLVQKTAHPRTGSHFPQTFGIGKLYSFLSNQYLAFGQYNQGKMMGLAKYGDLSLFESLPERNWLRELGRHVVCNAQIIVPPSNRREHRATDAAATAATEARDLAREYVWEGLYRGSTIFEPLRLPRRKRESYDALPDAYYASVARAGQHVLEQVAVRLGARLQQLVTSQNLCVAGGLGLNIDVNRRFVDTVGYHQLFVQPAASDAGIPLGCALWGRHMILGVPRDFVMSHAFLGRPYDQREILAALERFPSLVATSDGQNVSRVAAGLVAQGSLVGWYEGGSEYGPRALGHRSIVADPRRAEARDVLNNRVKHREPWRPFGCSVKQERANEYFELAIDSPFMLLAAPVRPSKLERIPAVLHVDNSSRIQTVSRGINGRFFDLIDEFEKLTGVPVLLNTSFNLAGDPIVESPADALDTFIRSGLDYLVMEDLIVRK